MTATEELRRMLDERKVKYVDDKTATGGYPHTSWRDEDWREARAIDFGDEKLMFHGHLTPAQAVEDTLGQVTCRNISNPPSGFLCSECRWGDFAEPSHLLTTAKFTDNDGGPNYCPNCGRKVISG